MKTKTVIFLIVGAVALLLALSIFASVLFIQFLYYGGPGYNDWRYEIADGKYTVERLNSESIVLCINTERPMAQTESDPQAYVISTNIVIDGYVTRFCFSDRYIGAASIKSEEVSPYLENSEAAKEEFFLIDMQTEHVYDYADESSYKKACEDFKTDLCDWIKTYPRPDGAK